MTRRPVLGVLLASATAALTVLAAAPAAAHNADGLGDVATNTRGLQVETSGEGKAMEFVANLQYDDSGQAQNGSDIEFMRIGRKEYALAGTLRGGMQIIEITDPRNPRRVAVYDCQVTQGDIQVWKNRGRVLASYTADGTFGTQARPRSAGATWTWGPARPAP